MTRNVAKEYIRENFRPEDRLAVVLLNKRTNGVVQRIARAERIASPDFQRFLRYTNAQRYEVYLSMNSLHEAAKGRTKADVHNIRHIYLDFDECGDQALQKMLARSDVPKPNYLLSSSPGKWQVVWNVDGFDGDGAEALQRTLARDTGADTAATDCAMVLRIPGFNNHKYAEPHRVEVQKLSDVVARPENFPRVPELIAPHRKPAEARSAWKSFAALPRECQSERDWAYARRALLRGDLPNKIVEAVAQYRDDKPDPE